MVNFTSRPLYPRGITPVPIEQEASLAPEPVWTVHEMRKCLASTAIRTPDRPAISPLTIPTTLPVPTIQTPDRPAISPVTIPTRLPVPTIRTPERPAISPVTLPLRYPCPQFSEYHKTTIFYRVCLINREVHCAYPLFLDTSFWKNSTGRTDGRAM
jgi:hypothetical protein